MSGAAIAARVKPPAPSRHQLTALTALIAVVAGASAYGSLQFLSENPKAIPVAIGVAPLLGLLIVRPRWIVPVFLGFIWTTLGPETLGGLPSPADIGAIALLVVAAWYGLHELRVAALAAAVVAVLALSILASGVLAADGAWIPDDALKSLAFLPIAALCVRRLADADRVAVVLCVVVTILGAGAAYSVLVGPIGPFTVHLPGRLDPEAPRASGLIFGEPNFFALSLATVMPFAFYLVSRGRWRTVVGSIAVLGIIAGILAAGSRGGMIAGLFGIAAWAVTSRRVARAPVIVAVAAILIAAPLFSAQLESGTERTVSGRATENKIAVAMFVDRPIVGVGPDQYPELYRDYAREIGDDPRTERTPHSLPLEILAEQGAFGLLAWAAAGLILFACARAGGVWHVPIGRAVIMALITYLVGSLFLHGSQLRLPYILAGLVIALATRAIPAERRTATG